MNLEFFNRETLPTGHRTNGNPALRVTSTGAVYLNSHLMDLLELEAGQGVELVFDTTERQWYIMKSDRSESFIVRGKKDSKHFQFNSVALCTKVLASFKEQKKSQSCRVTEACTHHENFKLYPLITV